VLAMRRSQAEARKIQQEITQLDRENKQLQNHVKDLKTDPSTMECIAREDFGLARPGEYIFKTHSKPGSRGCSAMKP
jgi:cell division protein FtsB